MAFTVSVIDIHKFKMYLAE